MTGAATRGATLLLVPVLRCNMIGMMYFPVFTGRREVIVEGVIAIWYFGGMIALVDHEGKIYWRDLRYPPYLTYYLILQPDPEVYRWS